MAFSSLKNAKLLPSLVSITTSAISRRGYSAASSLRMVRKQGEEKKVVKMMMMEGGADSAWVPDPVTGYYKPADRVGEIDYAELREMLLDNQKKVHQHQHQHQAVYTEMSQI